MYCFSEALLSLELMLKGEHLATPVWRHMLKTTVEAGGLRLWIFFGEYGAGRTPMIPQALSTASGHITFLCEMVELVAAKALQCFFFIFLYGFKSDHNVAQSSQFKDFFDLVVTGEVHLIKW